MNFSGQAETDYEDLHGMGMEALMQFFDEYLAKELKEIQLSAFPIIEHNLVRATVTPEIVRLISKYYKISENETLQRFYQSKTQKAKPMKKPVCTVCLHCRLSACSLWNRMAI